MNDKNCNYKFDIICSKCPTQCECSIYDTRNRIYVKLVSKKLKKIDYVF
jgi:hypothetical protein